MKVWKQRLFALVMNLAITNGATVIAGAISMSVTPQIYNCGGGSSGGGC
jgi:hypothetical protein